MHLPSVIAIHGLKRSGKGTISSHLAKTHGYAAEKFSGALKDMARVLLARVCLLDPDSIVRCIEGDLKEIPIPRLGGKSCRYLTQSLGTEWRDTLSSKMWGHLTLSKVASVVGSGGRASLDDLRFDHEVELLRSVNAELWLVETTRNRYFDEPVTTLPWDTNERPSFDVPLPVLVEMLDVLNAHRGLDVAEAREHFREPVAEFGHRSLDYALSTLQSVWLPMMQTAWTPDSRATAGHISERGLPREIFDHLFVNDGTIADLCAAVDAALQVSSMRDETTLQPA